jgi:hypothetical protein
MNKMNIPLTRAVYFALGRSEIRLHVKVDLNYDFLGAS